MVQGVEGVRQKNEKIDRNRRIHPASKHGFRGSAIRDIGVSQKLWLVGSIPGPKTHGTRQQASKCDGRAGVRWIIMYMRHFVLAWHPTARYRLPKTLQWGRRPSGTPSRFGNPHLVIMQICCCTAQHGSGSPLHQVTGQAIGHLSWLPPANQTNGGLTCSPFSHS